MLSEQEIEIIDLSLLPKNIFHFVPSELFNKFVDGNGDYDCRHKKEWGNDSSFIHTSPTEKQLKERVADVNWIKYPKNDKFLLLKINTAKIKSKVTYSIINGNIYHHIWGALPVDSFLVLEVDRGGDGNFLL